MQFKSFMEALKGKQHKIDKNKNGEIDAHDFKLLRKEEAEETIEESEERMARADYKVGASGRKSHKEIVFKDAESKDDDKKEMKEAKMSDADMAEKERIVKGMKKNISGFKARYGKDAKSVMYATATKQAMKEETVEEAVQKADIPAYLRKQQGQTPLKLSDLKRKDTISDKENLAKLRNEEADELEEGVFTDDEGIAKKLVAKHGKNVQSHDIKLALHMHPEGHKTTVDRVAGHVKKMLSVKEEIELDESVFADKEQATSVADKLKKKHDDGNYSVVADHGKHRVVHSYHSDSRVKKDIAKLNEEQIDEKSDQAKRNKIMKNMMDASRGARHKLNNPVPDAEPEHKTARAQNVAIGRALRSEEKKDDVPFDGPYTKTKPVKNSDGTTQSPMSRARQLAKDAMKKQMKEDIDRLFEKDDTEYDYEGEMAVTQLKTIIRHAEALQAKMQPNTNLPEWVQSKITLATDYIQTASDYLHSELEEGYYEKPASAYRRKGDEVGGGSSKESMEKAASDKKIKQEIAADRIEQKQKNMIKKAAMKQKMKEEFGLDITDEQADSLLEASYAPVAPVPDRKYIKGTPEHKAYKATKKPINGMPTNVKESFDADGNIVNSKVSYKEFAMMLEYEAKDGRYTHKGSYGGSYVDPEGADDADDKKPKQQPAEKRGRGRPAGAKSGAGKITGTSKLYK